MRKALGIIILIAASASARGLHKTPLPYAPESWQWRADLFSSLPVATAYANQFTADPPIIVPTRNAKWIVFHRILADLVDAGHDVAFVVHPNLDAAKEDYDTRWLINKGIVSTAGGQVIVWSIE